MTTTVFLESVAESCEAEPRTSILDMAGGAGGAGGAGRCWCWCCALLCAAAVVGGGRAGGRAGQLRAGQGGSAQGGERRTDRGGQSLQTTTRGTFCISPGLGLLAAVLHLPSPADYRDRVCVPTCTDARVIQSLRLQWCEECTERNSAATTLRAHRITQYHSAHAYLRTHGN